MIDEETIFKVEQERAFQNSKADLARALKAVESALHYLDETETFVSLDLDEAYVKLKIAENIIKGFVND